MMHTDRLLNEKIKDLSTRINGFRVLILHNDLLIAERMLVKILNALEKQKVYLVIYSNARHARLEKLLKLYSQNREFEILRKVEIIKVGTNSNTSFGRIQRIVDPHNLYPDSLIDSIYEISDESVIVFYGFVLDDFERFLEILDNVNTNSTILTEYPLVEYKDQILKEYHDLIIKIQKQDLYFSILVEPRVPICEEVNVQLDLYSVTHTLLK